MQMWDADHTLNREGHFYGTLSLRLWSQVLVLHTTLHVLQACMLNACVHSAHMKPHAY